MSDQAPVRWERDGEGVVTLVLDAPGAAVNTMTAEWEAAFAQAVARLLAEKSSVRGVILASAKKSFFAGADLKALLRLGPGDGPAVFRQLERVKKTLRALETAGFPVVAVIEGAALGGGWELALSAHARFVLDDASIALGLPEVTLGLLPAAGGVTKMTRLLGLKAAFPYLVEGRTFGPQEALRLGLVQGLAPEGVALFRAAREWIAAHPQARQPWDEPGWRMPGGGPSDAHIAQMLALAPAIVIARTRGLYPAPKAILAAMVEGAHVDVETALRIESRYLARLAVGPVAKNLILFFFARNAARSRSTAWKPAKAAILGAGTRGSALAAAHALCGIPCVLRDLSLEKAEAGRARALRVCEKKGRDPAEARALIHPSAQAADLSGCDLVIEVVPEDRRLKAQALREAEPYLAPQALMASGTPGLPVTGLAQAVRARERFVGLHFFPAADRMELVEIVRGRDSAEEALARACDYVRALGKVPIVVRDAPGFFATRTFGAFVLEGCAMLAEGVPPALVENAAHQAGMARGPLEALDEISLAHALSVIEQTADMWAAQGKPLPPAQPGAQVLVRMVREFGRTGRSGKGGFYDYAEQGSKRLWPELARLYGRQGTVCDFEELKDRFLYRQAIEALRCLEEGILCSVADGNLGSVLGIGFPAWTGGALRFVDHVGVAPFLARAEALAARHGERFAPPRLLREKAGRGEALG